MISPRTKGSLGSVMVGLALASLALAGCSSAGSSAGTSDEPDLDAMLRISTVVEPSLDPAQSREAALSTLDQFPVYDRLIQIGQDATFEPMLATRWTFSEDGRELTLDLRDDVTFTDGTPFDAEAVKANIERYQQTTGSQAALATEVIADVKVLAPHRVKLVLKRPTTSILATLSAPAGGSMVSPEAFGTDLDKNPVGTGAYEIESFTPGYEAVYKRRTDGDIWDPKTGKPEGISVRYVAEAKASLNALQSGQVDLIFGDGVVDQVTSELDQGSLISTPVTGSLRMIALYMNARIKPFDDVRVRQAVNYAINRESLVDAFATPNTQVLHQPWPHGFVGFDEGLEDSYPYDPDKARDLLEQAGYGDGVDGGTWLSSPVGTRPQQIQAVQADLKEVGIDISLQTMEEGQMIPAWGSGKYAGQLYSAGNASINPGDWLTKLYDTPFFIPGGAPAKVVKEFEGIDDPSLSQEQVEEKVRATTKRATEEAVYAPLYQYLPGYLNAPKVRGFEDLPFSPSSIGDLRNLWIAK